MAYPIWWCDTITVHHRSTITGRITWTPTTYTGAYFRHPSSTAKSTNHERKAGNAFCRFRAPAPIIANGDIVTLGAVDTEINDYVVGIRSSDYIAAHEGECFVVTELRDNTHTHTRNPHIYAGGA